ncbi:MAG: ribonuclease [Lachnospiraceae bacterium]|nr:ribonuclease [Lachnospiraceae bacterium]
MDPTGSGESQVQTEPQTQPQTSQAATQPQTTQAPTQPQTTEAAIAEDGRYSSKEDVALYLHTYGHLPSNFITKRDAEKLGWVASKGNLWKVTDHMSIGGDTFSNREGRLPTKKGRKYYECDIDYRGGSRGAKRIVFSNDGLIYYTNDHYETFELLYGNE